MGPLARLLLVSAGGAVGTAARYLVALGAVRWLGPTFPWGTLTVNVVGSFLLGVIMELALHGAIGQEVRLVLGAGVMGGFTTYSSFNYEALAFAQRGAWIGGASYVAATLLGCFAAGALGVTAARVLVAS